MPTLWGTETIGIIQSGIRYMVPLSDVQGLINPITKALAADATGQNVATTQPWFPSAGAITVKDKTAYKFDGVLMLTRAAGTTSHTTSLLFGGTATLTNIDYLAEASAATGNVLGTVSHISASAASAVAVTAANTAATENMRVRVSGIMRVNAGGTIIPQFQYSVAPGGAPTIKRGSYFEMTPLGINTGSEFGKGWA